LKFWVNSIEFSGGRLYLENENYFVVMNFEVPSREVNILVVHSEKNKATTSVTIKSGYP
jgi:hypothetical protein